MTGAERDDVERRWVRWDCEAYGEQTGTAGALCFISEPGSRLCASAAECAETMRQERERVHARIHALAAGGDPVGKMLAAEFPEPEGLLGGGGTDTSTLR